MELEAIYQIFLRHKQVVTDSRAIMPGCIFFAIKGEHFDGNQFAAEAIKNGAAYAVVDDPKLPGHERFLKTENVLFTLQMLAREYRRSFNIPVLAITGSNGKTTTKELVSAVLKTKYKVHFTRGNLNNHIGVPLTLLSMPAETEIAVIEMGANHQGEIDALAKITEPTHGLITNVGKAHLEGFGGIEGVKKGKSELYTFLRANGGTIFLCADEPFLQELAGKSNNTVQYGKNKPLGIKEENFTQITPEVLQPFISVSFKDEKNEDLEVKSNLLGSYNYPNLATAIAVGKFFKVPGIQIKKAVEDYVPSMMRSQLIRKGPHTFILDAYNANPTSMREAIMNLKQMDASMKIAILADMLELGEYSTPEHENIANLALAQNFDYTLLVGPRFGAVKTSGKCLFFPDVESVGSWFAAQRFSAAWILVKGSRGMRMEKLLDFIQD